jgi:hypothetical protein
LLYLIDSGGLAPTDLVWRTGEVEWKVAALFPELFPPAKEAEPCKEPPTPEPVPDRTQGIAQQRTDRDLPAHATLEPVVRRRRRRSPRKRPDDPGYDTFKLPSEEDEDRYFLKGRIKPGRSEDDEPTWDDLDDPERPMACPGCGEELNERGFCMNRDCDEE